MRPHLENTRSTGAKLAAQHSTRSNRSVSCEYSDCRDMLSELRSTIVCRVYIRDVLFQLLRSLTLLHEQMYDAALQL